MAKLWEAPFDSCDEVEYLQKPLRFRRTAPGTPLVPPPGRYPKNYRPPLAACDGLDHFIPEALAATPPRAPCNGTASPGGAIALPVCPLPGFDEPDPRQFFNPEVFVAAGVPSVDDADYGGAMARKRAELRGTWMDDPAVVSATDPGRFDADGPSATRARTRMLLRFILDPVRRNASGAEVSGCATHLPLRLSSAAEAERERHRDVMALDTTGPPPLARGEPRWSRRRAFGLAVKTAIWYPLATRYRHAKYVARIDDNALVRVRRYLVELHAMPRERLWWGKSISNDCRRKASAYMGGFLNTLSMDAATWMRDTPAVFDTGMFRRFGRGTIAKHHAVFRSLGMHADDRHIGAVLWRFRQLRYVEDCRYLCVALDPAAGYNCSHGLAVHGASTPRLAEMFGMADQLIDVEASIAAISEAARTDPGAWVPLPTRQADAPLDQQFIVVSEGRNPDGVFSGSTRVNVTFAAQHTRGSRASWMGTFSFADPRCNNSAKHAARVPVNPGQRRAGRAPRSES